jgi:hypothetical protein
MVDQNTTIDTLDNVIALRTPQFTDEEALAWLKERRRITASASHLARVWGWPERRTRRQLDRWKLAGLIRRKGKSITVIAAKSDTPISAKRTASGQARTRQTDATCATFRHQSGPQIGRAAFGRSDRARQGPSWSHTPAAASWDDSIDPIIAARSNGPTRIRAWPHRLPPWLFGRGWRLLAFGPAIVGVTANAIFGVSMGITIWQELLYALLRASIDGIALWLPSMALWLSQNQHRAFAAAAWVMCAGAIYASALVANGFLSSTVENTIADRQSLIERRASLAKHKKELERDFAVI